MSNFRKTELKLPDGTWKEVEFYELREDDIIRMFDPPDWTPVLYEGTDFAEMLVTDKPYLNKKGIWIVQVIGYEDQSNWIHN